MAKAKPEAVTKDLLPRWRLKKVLVETERRELDDEFDAEIGPAVASFVDSAEAGDWPAPNPEDVAARVRHVLKHSRGGEAVRIVAKPTPPYFGVTTYRAETPVRRSEP